MPGEAGFWYVATADDVNAEFDRHRPGLALDPRTGLISVLCPCGWAWADGWITKTGAHIAATSKAADEHAEDARTGAWLLEGLRARLAAESGGERHVVTASHPDCGTAHVVIDEDGHPVYVVASAADWHDLIIASRPIWMPA